MPPDGAASPSRAGINAINATSARLQDAGQPRSNVFTNNKGQKPPKGVNQSNGITATASVQLDTSSPRDGFYRSQNELI